MEAIYIMWLRQIKRWWRSKPRVVGALAQPLLFLVAMGFGFGPIYERAGGGDYIQFLAPGIISMSVLFTSIFNGISLIWDKQFGFLKETLVAPVSRASIMLGRTLGGATVATLQGLIVLVISYAVGFRIGNIMHFPLALLFMFLIAFFFTALGTAIASRLEDMEGFHLIMNFLVMPIFFLSGALFPLDELPPLLKRITSLNPLSYGVDGLRGALNHSLMGVGVDLAVMVFFATAVFMVGCYLFSRIEIKN